MRWMRVLSREDDASESRVDDVSLELTMLCQRDESKTRVRHETMLDGVSMSKQETMCLDDVRWSRRCTMVLTIYDGLDDASRV